MKFKARIRYWKPEAKGGLAVAEIPSEHIAKLGGLKQMRVRGTINGATYESNVMPAGGGRLALSVSRKMLDAGKLAVGDEAIFAVERADAR